MTITDRISFMGLGSKALGLEARNTLLGPGSLTTDVGPEPRLAELKEGASLRVEFIRKVKLTQGDLRKPRSEIPQDVWRTCPLARLIGKVDLGGGVIQLTFALGSDCEDRLSPK